MKLFKYLTNGFFALIILSLLTACTDEEIVFSADADVIFMKKVVDDETVYGIDYYAYGNTSMSSAKVSTPFGVTLLMDSYSSGYTYASITDEDDYDTSVPTTGTYTFTLTGSNEETLEVTDTQDFYNLGFAEIDSMSFYDSYDGFYVSWNPVSGAEAYVVLLYDSSDNLVFTGDELDADTHEYIVVDDYSDNWEETPVSDDKYTLQIQSIIYDATDSELDDCYNVQEISYSDTTITWE
jgi:hypothetical protein